MGDDSNDSTLAELQIDRQRERLRPSGPVRGDSKDPMFRGLVKWFFGVIGALSVLIALGVYDKLSTISDTLILVVAEQKQQGAQTAELKQELRDLRNANAALQRQVDSLEGKTLRGIEGIVRGH